MMSAQWILINVMLMQDVTTPLGLMFVLAILDLEGMEHTVKVHCLVFFFYF